MNTTTTTPEVIDRAALAAKQFAAVGAGACGRCQHPIAEHNPVDGCMHCTCGAPALAYQAEIEA